MNAARFYNSVLIHLPFVLEQSEQGLNQAVFLFEKDNSSKGRLIFDGWHNSHIGTYNQQKMIKFVMFSLFSIASKDRTRPHKHRKNIEKKLGS